MTKLLYYKKLEAEIFNIKEHCNDLKAINDLLMNNCGKTLRVCDNLCHCETTHYRYCGTLFLDVLNENLSAVETKRFTFAGKIFSRKELKYLLGKNGCLVYNSIQANSYNEFINRVSNYIGKTLDTYMARLKVIYKKLGVQEEVK
jgi:hypothetical protein